MRAGVPALEVSSGEAFDLRAAVLSTAVSRSRGREHAHCKPPAMASANSANSANRRETWARITA